MNTKKPFLIRSSRGAPDLDRLARMKPTELHQLYKDRSGCDVPAGNSEYARRRIAWHVQAEREGGLPESARQHALAIAKDSKLRLCMAANVDRRSQGFPLEHATTTRIVSDHDSRLPMPGSVIVKKHKSRTIIVKVLSAGFEYDGRRFPSLSAIANEITGTRWNGFVFFGLAKETTRGRER
jgi:hypothetical protein